MVAEWQGTGQTRWAFFGIQSSVRHLCWVPGMHGQGTGAGGGGEWTKHKPWLVLLTGPPQKSLASVQNGISCFDFEIWHHINITGQACTELLTAEEKKRENEHLNKTTDSCLEQVNMIYRLLPFSLAKKKKKPPKPGGIEEEGEGRSAAGDRFSPERRESHPQSCEK